ncbi:dTDP-4-dehydrorhamnose reductase [Aromatoleum petrolei]|nr:dTDP-4-dehydrorhamnose reductase [Aromatoleum petrolei]
MNKVKILVLGASGMLGNAVFKFFSGEEGFEVFGTLRSARSAQFFDAAVRQRLIAGVDVENADALLRLFSDVRPNVVVNCIGLVKQLSEADDPLAALPINSLLPHRLARMCALVGSRLVHLSTDCVFAGTKGDYTENDLPDATDLYGRSKLLGEVDYPNAIALRTSIIGHELEGARSLIGWFLAQESKVRGFKRAIFSGLPTVEIARVIKDYVIPNPELHGLYHVSADPISKYDLLTLVARAYGKAVDIEPDEVFVIDRSLNSERFRSATGFRAEKWPDLVTRMRDFG